MRGMRGDTKNQNVSFSKDFTEFMEASLGDLFGVDDDEGDSGTVSTEDDNNTNGQDDDSGRKSNRK
jgi:hypothetical protein